jgi:pimeloyl-ACP methyl ester carboxylesterase
MGVGSAHATRRLERRPPGAAADGRDGRSQSAVLLIYGRYDRIAPFEVSIAILNHNIADSRLVLLNNCGHWPPFEKPAEWTVQVLAFLKGY